jgi:hypothetical protein
VDYFAIESSPGTDRARPLDAGVFRPDPVVLGLLRYVRLGFLRMAGRYAKRLQIALSMLAAIDESNDMIAGPFPDWHCATALCTPSIKPPEHANLDAGRDSLIVGLSDPLWNFARHDNSRS